MQPYLLFPCYKGILMPSGIFMSIIFVFFQLGKLFLVCRQQQLLTASFDEKVDSGNKKLCPVHRNTPTKINSPDLFFPSCLTMLKSLIYCFLCKKSSTTLEIILFPLHYFHAKHYCYYRFSDAWSNLRYPKF